MNRMNKKIIAWLSSGGIKLLAPECQFLRDLEVWCKVAIHLQCAGGTDTLSLWKMGAAAVVGVDISERMIAVANARLRHCMRQRGGFVVMFLIHLMNLIIPQTLFTRARARCPG